MEDERKTIDISNLTYEQFQAIKDKMDAAEEDTTPYAVVKDEQVHVLGDPNKTELKKFEYTIEFAYPNRPHWLKQIDENEIFAKTDQYIGVRRTYKDVWVSPRVQTTVQAAFIELYQFFNFVSEDGELRDLTVDELKMALRSLNQEMVEAMCHAVASVLGIGYQEEQFMLTISTAVTTVKMCSDFPELINGMDFFIDNSSEEI